MPLRLAPDPTKFVAFTVWKVAAPLTFTSFNVVWSSTFKFAKVLNPETLISLNISNPNSFLKTSLVLSSIDPRFWSSLSLLNIWVDPMLMFCTVVIPVTNKFSVSSSGVTNLDSVSSIVPIVAIPVTLILFSVVWSNTEILEKVLIPKTSKSVNEVIPKAFSKVTLVSSSIWVNPTISFGYNVFTYILLIEAIPDTLTSP